MWPGSRKVGEGQVGVSAFSEVSQTGESGGTRGENGGSVERRVHWMLPWNHSALQGTPVLPGDSKVPVEPWKAG